MTTTAPVKKGGYLRPVGDQIIVRRSEADEKTPGGIVLPEQAKEKPTHVTVFAVGCGHLQQGVRIPLEVKEGDEVYFDRYGGSLIEVDEEEFIVIREANVLAVLTRR